MSTYVREEVVEYNYDFQCWVKEGVIQRCGHVEHCECLGRRYAGLSVVALYRKLSLAWNGQSTWSTRPRRARGGLGHVETI